VVHLIVTLFFSLTLILTGIAAQQMTKKHQGKIGAALRGEMPVTPVQHSNVRQFMAPYSSRVRQQRIIAPALPRAAA
jgi:hypothetical protein